MSSVPCLRETYQEQLTQLVRALDHIYSSNIKITTNDSKDIIFHLPQILGRGDQTTEVFKKMQNLLSALSLGEQGSTTWKDLQVVCHDRQVLHVLYKVDGRTKKNIIRSALTPDTYRTIELCEGGLKEERASKKKVDIFLLKDN
jgi:hypothetical protein